MKPKWLVMLTEVDRTRSRSLAAGQYEALSGRRGEGGGWNTAPIDIHSEVASPVTSPIVAP